MSTALLTVPKFNSKTAALSIHAYVNDLRQQRKDDLATALEQMQQYIDSLSDVVMSLSTALSGASIKIPASITTERFPLTTPTVVIKPLTAPTVGTFLRVIITQDATGGRQFTWDSIVKWAPIDIETLPSTVSSFLLVGDTDPIDSVVRWFLLSFPLTGQTP